MEVLSHHLLYLLVFHDIGILLVYKFIFYIKHLVLFFVQTATKSISSCLLVVNAV